MAVVAPPRMVDAAERAGVPVGSVPRPVGGPPSSTSAVRVPDSSSARDHRPLARGTATASTAAASTGAAG